MEQRLFISAAISFIRTRQQTITKNRREGTKCAYFDPVLKSILTAVYCYGGASLCLVNFFHSTLDIPTSNAHCGPLHMVFHRA